MGFGYGIDVDYTDYIFSRDVDFRSSFFDSCNLVGTIVNGYWMNHEYEEEIRLKLF